MIALQAPISENRPFPDGYLVMSKSLLRVGFVCLLPLLACSGCVVFTVADAAVSVAATTVKAGATVIGTTVDVAATGVKAATGSSDKQ